MPQRGKRWPLAVSNWHVLTQLRMGSTTTLDNDVLKCALNTTIANVVFSFNETHACGWAITLTDWNPLEWLEIVPAHIIHRDQGWKLHVSATINSAISVLEKALPVLRAAGVSFKVPNSLRDLAYLNSGKGGLSQVGKFLTIYPNDDEQIVRLAKELDDVTDGLPGPLVLSDRCIRPGSLVHYRYGSFVQRNHQNAAGQIVASITNPRGEVEEDVRSHFNPPIWATDPFQACGMLPPPPQRNPMMNDRYLVFDSVYQSAKGNLYIALDVDSEEVNNCLIKEARKDVYLDTGFKNAIELLQNEKHVLEALRSCDSCPRIYDYFEAEGNAYLVLEFIEGTNLKSYFTSNSFRGIYLEESQIIDLALKLCSIVKKLHSQGIIHRDLKPGNILITDSGHLKLLDFELAYDSTKTADGYPILGTRGYNSPQQMSGGLPSVADDVFGIGSLIYYFATNCDPSLAPREWSLSERPIFKLNRRVGPALDSVVARCVEREVDQRYSSVAVIEDALNEINRSNHDPSISFVTLTSVRQSESHLDAASALGKRLCETAQPMRHGVAWRSTHPQTYGVVQRDIQTGASGIALFLIDLFRYTKDDRFLTTVVNTSAWLNSIDYNEEYFLPGLYVGEAGVGLVNLLLSQVLTETRYLDNSFTVADQIYQHLGTSPDLYNGLAGCGLYFLILGLVTRERSYLSRAAEIGDRLVSSAEHSENGCGWRIPDGYGELSGQKFLGFAHGAAGIGYFLLELFEATGCSDYKDTADQAASFIISKAEPALNDGTGINWPDQDDGQIQSLFWCHGAAGIVRFLLRSSEVHKSAIRSQISQRAGRLVANASGWLNPTQCHGVSGNIECLLDLYQSTLDQQWLGGAFDLADILLTLRVQQEDVFLWPSEEPTIVTPDFMVGYSGVGETLLRLYDCESHPHLITSRYFRDFLLNPPLRK